MSARIAYFDCFAGASGDMILGALLDAGLPLAKLKAGLAQLPLPPFRLTARRAQRGALWGTRATVTLPPGPQERRSPADIHRLIEGAPLAPKLKAQAQGVFRRLAEAEARIHNLPIDEVHFHEVGAADALVDVLGTVIGLELLGVEAVFVSPLPLGGGRVKSAHGVLPVPAPATLELLAQARAPLRPAPEDESAHGEVLTPTAAALFTALGSFQRPALRLERVGHGVGQRHLPHAPNVLRLWLGAIQPQDYGPEVALLETNIDDMNPQLYGYVMERLFAAGALDVWFTPIQMKKDRPAVMVSVLAPPEREAALAQVLLRETTTLGVRTQVVRRHEAERHIVAVETSLGTVPVKLRGPREAPWGLAPEYEACRKLAQRLGQPLAEVLRLVAAEAAAQLLPGG